jgi:hypothetical protein
MGPNLEGSLWATFHLLSGDPDTLLNLQHAFAAVYDLLGAIDYAQLPDVPLAGEAAPMAESILRATGLRPA